MISHLNLSKHCLFLPLHHLHGLSVCNVLGRHPAIQHCGYQVSMHLYPKGESSVAHICLILSDIPSVPNGVSIQEDGVNRLLTSTIVHCMVTSSVFCQKLGIQMCVIKFSMISLFNYSDFYRWASRWTRIFGVSLNQKKVCFRLSYQLAFAERTLQRKKRTRARKNRRKRKLLNQRQQTVSRPLLVLRHHRV